MDVDQQAIGTTTLKIAGKVGMNLIVPGSGAVVDIVDAAVDIANGNYISAGINLVSGIIDIFSFGLWGTYKEAAKEVGKQAATSSVKASVKEATKKIGKDASKEIAKGVSKKAAKDSAILASKKAAKEIGKKYGSALGKGMLENTVERAAWEVTNNTLNQGIQRVTFSGMLEAGFTEIGEALLNTVPKQTFTSGYALASEAAATEYLKKANQKIVVMNVTNSIVTTYVEKQYSS